MIAPYIKEGEILDLGFLVCIDTNCARGGWLTALDVGSGEGADAIWLASRGWRVTAVDFATNATQRPLLESILGYLMETENDIHPDRQGLAFLLIKVVIDSMDQTDKLPS